MKHKVALIVGRFQPFHKGHLYLVKKALEKAEKIIFGIGSANIDDEYNPLSYDQRKKMLEIVIQNEKIKDRVIKIVPLDDVYNNEKWLKIVKGKAGEFNLVVGNSEWVNKILEKAGYKIWDLGYYKKNLYEGWRIRKIICEGRDFKQRVPPYLVPFLMSKLKCQMSNGNSKFKVQNLKFSHCILGGTFDHFHLGHQKFIETAFEKSERISIGLATEKLYQNKLLAKTIESYAVRKKNLISFLKQKKFFDRAKIIPLKNIYGSGDKEEKIDAIFVTKETYKGALAINKKRKERGWPEIKIETIAMVKGDDGQEITSERIRIGEIDRKGNNFQFSPDLIGIQKKQLVLPEEMRESLRKPLGMVITSLRTPGVPKLDRTIQNVVQNAVMTISVGDIITMELIKVGIEPDVKIIDFRTRRKEFPISNFQFPMNFQFPISKKYQNNPGTINTKTANALKKKIQQAVITKEKQWLVIEGEEDLLALPAILFAPLNVLVLYGQWNMGVVMVQVTEKMKKKVIKLLNKFN